MRCSNVVFLSIQYSNPVFCRARYVSAFPFRFSNRITTDPTHISFSMTLKEILADPGISYWLKDAIKTAYERDPIDALIDARRLLKMLGERYTQIVNRDLAN